jgi:hypothetical protein
LGEYAYSGWLAKLDGSSYFCRGSEFTGGGRQCWLLDFNPLKVLKIKATQISEQQPSPLNYTPRGI